MKKKEDIKMIIKNRVLDDNALENAKSLLNEVFAEKSMIAYSIIDNKWHLEKEVINHISKYGIGSFIYKIEFDEISNNDITDLILEKMNYRYSFILDDSASKENFEKMIVALNNMDIACVDLPPQLLSFLIINPYNLNFKLDLSSIKEKAFLIKNDIDNWIAKSILEYEFEFLEINYKDLFGKDELIKLANKLTSKSWISTNKEVFIGTYPIERFFISEGIYSEYEVKLKEIETLTTNIDLDY